MTSDTLLRMQICAMALTTRIHLLGGPSDPNFKRELQKIRDLAERLSEIVANVGRAQ